MTPKLIGGASGLRRMKSRRYFMASLAVSALLLGALAVPRASTVLSPVFAQTIAPPQSVAPVRLFSFADVIERVKPAVVSVKIRSMPVFDRRNIDDPRFEGFPPGFPHERFRDRFGFRGDPRGGPPSRGFVTGQGSGFFISADGYIVTNYHVVDGARDVDVVTDDGKTYSATVVGTDRRTDLALLKVKAEGQFPFVQFAPHAPRVGDWVLAIGNPYGLGGTVTAGIVSARGRDIGTGVQDDYLQIDAAVNRGNSGGPTFDIDGNVVGVNTAIFSPSGGNVGIAFAIPASTVMRVVAALKDGGVVERGFLGVETGPVGDEAANLGLKDSLGALVISAGRDHPAAKAGIRVGDVIRQVNGQPIRDARDLARRIGDLRPGTPVELVIWRDGKDVKVTVSLGKRPPEGFDERPIHRRRG